MRKASFGLIALALVAAVGCGQGTPGGPGVQATPPATQTQTTNKPVITNSKETFSLKTPMLATSIKQGETKSMSISIQRGSDFAEDVTLHFAGLPNGITFEPMAPVILHGDKEAKISVTATEDAAIGDFTVNVTGHPTKSGPDAENELKLAVSAK